MSKISKILLRASISFGLIWIVFYKTKLLESAGRDELFAMFVATSMPFLIVSLLIGVWLNFLSSLKWWILLRARGVPASFTYIWALYYIGKFYNLFLPTSVGGDIARVYGLGTSTGQTVEAAASVIVDRFTGMITLFVLAGVTLSLGFAPPGLLVSSTGMIVAVATAVGLTWLFLGRSSAKALESMSARARFLQRVSSRMIEVRSTILAYGTSSIMVPAFCFSALFYFFSIINVWVSALVFADAVPLRDVSIAVPTIMVVMNLPISIGGIGLMELAYTQGFEAIRLGTVLGLSTALLMRAKTILDAVIGGGLHLLLGLSTRSRDRDPAA